jgi:Mrp family chromosome partitioning ATPase
MVPINLCVATREADYVRRLADYVRLSPYGRDWRVTGFSTEDALRQYLKAGYPADLLLVAPEFAETASGFRPGVPIALLVGRGGEPGTDSGLPTVSQFQPVPNLIRKLEAIRAGHGLPRASAGGAGSGPLVAAVYSPSGGSGVTTTALCMAQLAAKSGTGAFYLDLDPFGGVPGGKTEPGGGLPDLLYTLQARPEEAADVFERVRTHDAELGIDRFPGGCPPEEKLELGADAAERLIRTVAACRDYGVVIVDLGSVPTGAHLGVFARSDAIFWIVPDHPSGRIKSEAALGFFRRRDPKRLGEIEPRIRPVAAAAGRNGSARGTAGLRFVARMPDVPRLRGAGRPEEAAGVPELQGACLDLLAAAGWRPEGGMPDARGARGAPAAGSGQKQDRFA